MLKSICSIMEVKWHKGGMELPGQLEIADQGRCHPSALESCS